MNITVRTSARVAAWTTAAVLGLATLSGIAAAQSQSQSSEPKPSKSTSAEPRKRDEDGRKKHSRRGPKGFGRRVLHGETVVAGDNGPVTHVVQRGVVTAVSGTSFTVRSSDGFTLTWTRNAETKVRTAPKDQPQRPLAVGDDVMTHGVREGSGVVARHVRGVSGREAVR